MLRKYIPSYFQTQKKKTSANNLVNDIRLNLVAHPKRDQSPRSAQHSTHRYFIIISSYMDELKVS